MRPEKPNRTPGRPKQAEQTLPLQDHILRTSAYLFMEKGYEPISLQTIAQICDVTKASIYYYFDNKAELFTASILYLLGMAHRSTQKILQEEIEFKLRLERIAIAKMKQHHMDMETLLRESRHHLSEAQYERIVAAEQAIHGLLAEYFQIAMDQGWIRRADALFCAHAFSSLVMLGARQHVVASVNTPEQMAAAVVELFWGGVQSGPEDATL